MSERIIFQIDDYPMRIFTPLDIGNKTLIEFAQSFVSKGVPFWVVDASSIPQDRVFRDAWRLDLESLGSPDGIGTYEYEEPQP